MSHDVGDWDLIYTYDGRETWHDINTVVGTEPENEEDAYKKSGLDWEVKLETLQFASPDFHGFRADSVFGKALTTTNKDNERLELAVVSPSYTPLQNRSLFTQAHPFVEHGFATYETAGSIRDRRAVWLSLFLGLDYVTAEDAIAKRILFCNFHTGDSTARAGFCPNRTVCNNTLSANLKSGRFLEIKHSKNVEENFKTITETMDVVNKKWLATMETYRKLTKIVVNADKFDQYITKCLMSNKGLENKFAETETALIAEGYSDAQVEEARRKFEAQLFPEIKKRALEARELAPGAKLQGTYGTAWGAYQVVTYLTSHERGSSPEARLYSNLFEGEGKRINQRGLELAIAL